jgi:hypothetical protein
MGDGVHNYELIIDEATLYMRKVKIPFKYPLTRVETIQYTFNKGVVCETSDNFSSGIFPKRIIFGMVEATAAKGSYLNNPFNFKNFDLSQISVTVDNHDVPNSPLNLNFKENSYIRAYYNLFSGINRAGLDWGNEITEITFIGGYGLYSFDLTPDKCNGDHFNVVKKGNLRIKLSFPESSANVLSFYIYMEYDNLLEITKARNVIFDYTV